MKAQHRSRHLTSGSARKKQLTFKREIEKLEKDIGGIQDMNCTARRDFRDRRGFPQNRRSLEAKKLGIPLIGVVDSNHSPIGIDYVIPGNDDSSKAVALYATRHRRRHASKASANAVNEVVKMVQLPRAPTNLWKCDAATA